MGLDYADVARPLVDLTRKDVSFKWTELHKKAVRQLKQRLIDFTALQVPDTKKPFDLYTNASGYAIGTVLEQVGKPIGFLSQVMNQTQQKYSIYDQEFLALVTALDKWSHLLRVTKVTAHTNHQALTHLQQLQASKPLRGRTTRWLDFLAEFPDLRITYVQGTRNQGDYNGASYHVRLSFVLAMSFMSMSAAILPVSMTKWNLIGACFLSRKRFLGRNGKRARTSNPYIVVAA
ncbi:OSJNBa0079C19.6 protein, related [Eimeria necatrix]|uniref:OSJNBa0079C19.6 protein, related n=1 Tax=Eimeria necatrix TaxID=51315 RepID=U6MH86_9EIME|nr:OSJNBa0079C19.6 protein, related [Eimeria necatrix]CDJ63582.1 OSJNBa0079C19.6 protein, related [Eimeria necatrix]